MFNPPGFNLNYTPCVTPFLKQKKQCIYKIPRGKIYEKSGSMSDFQSKTQRFHNWVNSNYSKISPKFEIADLRSAGQGRALIATDNIKKDEVLFEIPREAILNIETAQISKVRPENKSILESLNQWQALIICVSYEWFLGDKSKLFDYFNVLPLEAKAFTTLMFWSDEELAYLKPSGVLNRIGKDAAEEMFVILTANVITEKLQCPELAEFLTMERFHIVASLIMSYSFDVDHPSEVIDNEEGGEEEEEEEKEELHIEEDESELDEDIEEGEDSNDNEQIEDAVFGDSYFKSMVPLADTLNSNTKLFNATLKYEKTKLVMVAEKDIKKGDQIFNIYGELPNSEILRKYGYVELPSSNFEFAEISLSIIKTFFESSFTKRLSFMKEPQAETLLNVIFENIQESKYLEELLIDENDGEIVADRYEIYAGGELLPELLLLILIVTSLYQAAESDEKWFKKVIRSVERKPSSELLSLIDRTILKSHQLLEDKSIITKSTMQNIKEIIKLRINEYPTHITDASYKLPETYKSFNKKELSEVVLYNEVQCLKEIIDGNFPPRQKDGTLKFTVIEDQKFLKNLLKRKTEENNAKIAKRQKKS